MFDWRTRSAGKPARLLFRWLVCLACGLGPFVSSGAQEETPSARQRMPVFSVESAMVVVDVTVRDGKGKLVEGLKKEDFQVFEDNVPQGVVTFTSENVPIGSAARAAAQAEDPGAAPPVRPSVVNLSLDPAAPVRKEDLADKRLIILFFDLSSLETENLVRSVDAARDFIAAQTGPQDLMAVATYSSTLSLVQDFTNDRDLLLGILGEIASEEQEAGAAETDGSSESSEDVFVPDSVQFNIFNTDRRLSALETLAKMYREFPERKSLVYFSSGMTTTGVENNAQIRSTVDTANRSNLSIYTVDSQGLVALPPGGDASRGGGGRGAFGGSGMMQQRNSLSGSQETLVTLANDTGGRSFADSNDLSLALKQVQADTNVYYVLGYFSTNAKEDGKYRRIRVAVTRPGLKVSHRPGYFAAKSFRQLTQQEKDLQLTQAMGVERPFVDVPLILQADVFRKDDGTNYVPISIEILGDGLQFEEKGDNREARFEFVAQAADPKGRVTGVARDSVQVKLPAEKAERLKAGGIFYSTGFQLRAGEHRLKFLVRDNVTGKMGSFEQPVRVPVFDLKKLALSSIVLGNQLSSAAGDADSGVRHQGAMRRFQQRMPAYDPMVFGNRKVLPSIGNVFLSRQTVYVYFQVYGAAKDPQTRKPCIETDLMLIRDNTKILETVPQYTREWTNERGGFSRMAGRGAMGEPAGDGRGGGPPPGGPGGMEFPGRGGMGPMGAPPGMPGPGEREGESTVAISLPLKNLKTGTYALQVHVRDCVAGANLFRRVPIVIR